MEASPITLLPRLNDREIAFAVAACNDNSRIREHYRFRDRVLHVSVVLLFLSSEEDS